MFENPRRGRQARKFTTNFPKILDLKWSSEEIFSENCRWVPLIQAHTTYVFAFWKRNWKYQMPVRTKDLDKAIAEVIGTFEGVEDIIA